MSALRRLESLFGSLRSKGLFALEAQTSAARRKNGKFKGETTETARRKKTLLAQASQKGKGGAI